MQKLFQSKEAKYDYRRVFLDFNRSLNTIKDKASLISSILTRIHELLPTQAAYLFWENNDATRYLLMNDAPGKGRNLYLLPDDGLIRWLQLNEKPLVVSFTPEYAGIFSDNDAEIVRTLGCVLVCPLKANNQFKGIILLGKRKDNKPYADQDLEMLAVLLDNAALAIENVTYHEERVAHLKHIFQTDRLAVIGQLAAGAAHEIRNPLTGIRSAIQYIQGDIREPRKQAILKSALSEVDRINDILAGLLSFSRQNNPVKREFDLIAVMDQTLGLIKNTRIKKQIEFVTSWFAPTAPIVADSDQLKQVFMNIFLNAIDAIDNEGIIRIDIQPTKSEGETFYAITVTDNGKGIDPESMEKLFDPFYTTKQEGTGLGLSITYGIVQRHRGNIEISNQSGGGARVTIQLPQGKIG